REPHDRRHRGRRDRDRGDPAHPRSDHLRCRRDRRPRQPRGRCIGEVRGTSDGKGLEMDSQVPASGVDRSTFGQIEEALDDLRAGKIVLVVDDADRENEGDFIIAAEKCTPEAINFMVTHGRGIVCLPVAGGRLDELQIPQMVSTNGTDDTAFTVSIDYRPSITTGTSAYD